ncbi:MAG: DUF4031 domain-containing protein [Mycolicibacterium cosmeticum]|nr:DUF4031 domain-containing protein [Mycolicibacterium cosmeticum]
MTVYVDDMRVPATANEVLGRWSWLYCDGCDDDELHAFAQRLGVPRSWFKEGGKVSSHYDVTDPLRDNAIQLGAVQVGVFSTEAIVILADKLAARGEVLSPREAHRLGLCIDCKADRHSAGRTRCNACHTDYTNPPRPPAGRP